jgi:hypothetical protein
MIKKSDFPYFFQQSLNIWGEENLALEEKAKQLTKKNFEISLLSDFIRDVCRWGNYAGIASRIFMQNAINDIREKFIGAWRILVNDRPDVRKALIRINEIKNLGKPSFASKHLRFLRPQFCPVLDSVIRNGVGIYSENAMGYEKFSRDCWEIANVLEQNGIINPNGREDGKWFAADIEMAIYRYLRPLS